MWYKILKLYQAKVTEAFIALSRILDDRREPLAITISPAGAGKMQEGETAFNLSPFSLKDPTANTEETANAGFVDCFG